MQQNKRRLLAASAALSALMLTGCHHWRRPGPPGPGPGPGPRPAGNPGYDRPGYGGRDPGYGPGPGRNPPRR